jgi:outer membrane protein TolC
MNTARRWLACSALVALTGCASLGINEQRAATEQFATAQKFNLRLPDNVTVEALLAQPLTQDDAVRIALATSPTYLAARASLEAQSASWAKTAQAPNPLFMFERLVRKEAGGVDLDIGRMLATSLFDWLALPSRADAASRQQAMLNVNAARTLAQTAAQARQAWVRAVAAQQAASYFVQVREAAEASAELARRMFAVGNFSKLQRAREQAFYADATSGQARAQHAALAAREALVRTLGLTSEQANALKLPEKLPNIPTPQLSSLEITEKALNERLDVRLATQEAQFFGATRTFARVHSVLGEVHIAGVRNSETGKPRQRGVEIDLPLPIFDWGGAKRAEFTAQQRAAELRAQDATRRASSQLREAYSAYVTTHDLAKHYRDEIVPLRKTIADEMLLKYNGMLVGVFELLADAREQIGSVIAAIDAQRDFWLAEAALQSAILGAPADDVSLAPAMMKSSGGGDAH